MYDKTMGLWGPWAPHNMLDAPVTSPQKATAAGSSAAKNLHLSILDNDQKST
jgi:hypothetical protein